MNVLGYNFKLWNPPRRKGSLGGVFISFNKNVIMLSKDLMKCMDYPEYVQPLCSDVHGQAAIRVCGKDDQGALQVRMQNGCAYKLYDTYACKEFARIAGVEFSGHKFHRVNGKYVADEHCGIFDLRKHC